MRRLACAFLVGIVASACTDGAEPGAEGDTGDTTAETGSTRDTGGGTSGTDTAEGTATGDTGTDGETGESTGDDTGSATGEDDVEPIPNTP